MGRKLMHSSGASVASSSTKKKKKKKTPPMESVDSSGLSAMTDDFSRVSTATSKSKKKKSKKGSSASKTATMTTASSVALSATGSVDANSVGASEKLRKALRHMNSSQSGEKERIDFLKDPKEQMTYGRRIALALSGYSWYNPKECQWRMELLESDDDDDDDEDDNDDGAEKEQKKEKKQEKQEKSPDEDELDKSARQESIDEIMSHVETRPPSISRKEYPVLAKAWAYFEHSTLPRYIVEDDEEEEDGRKQSEKQELTRAEPGEDDDPTMLYDPFKTPLSQMGDFGLGIGLYFWTLRTLAILCLLAGLMSLPNILYYSSDSYSNYQAGVPNLLKGSAICTNTQFVPCPNCTAKQFQRERFGTAVVNTTLGTTETLNFALRNHCNGATLRMGMVNLGVLFLMILGMQWMSHSQQKQEVAFDEDEQTAQDYSVHITNPPPDAFDPEEWRTFFKEKFDGAHATAITIAINNDLLVRALAERREALKKMELLVEPGTKLDTLSLAYIAAEIEQNRGFLGTLIAKVAPGLPELFTKVASLEAKIGGLAQLEYKVTNVFVSFEYEHDQRQVLSGLNISDWEAIRQKSQPWSIPFRDEHLLQAQEPEEPNTLVWENLNINRINLLKILASTTTAALLSIFLIALLINFLHNRESNTVAAIAISVSNSVFPLVARFLTGFERHSTEGDKQTSLYFKINVFRWVNTAIVITIITPFTRTLTNGGGLLKSIYAIFFAEVITSNVIQLVDVGGHLSRHFLAPRAASQDLMNLGMQGTDFELAERYTNMTKVLFLALWYNAIYPGAFFMTFVALYLTYFADRFSLMRSWRRKPMLGTTIARFSRRYFFSIAVVAMAVISGYNWAGFPFDNLCNTDDPASSAYIGDFTVTATDGQLFTTTILDGDTNYVYCSQYLFRNDELRQFPPSPKGQPPGREWMTSDQETVVEVYGWAALGVMALVAWSLLFGFIKGIEGFFRAEYKPSGEDQGIPFSGVKSISTYVPQVVSNVHSYPLLACNIDGIDPEIFDWTDPSRPHGYYDLTKDCEELIGKEKMDMGHPFSVLSHVPPPNPFMSASA